MQAKMSYWDALALPAARASRVLAHHDLMSSPLAPLPARPPRVEPPAWFLEKRPADYLQETAASGSRRRVCGDRVGRHFLAWAATLLDRAVVQDQASSRLVALPPCRELVGFRHRLILMPEAMRWIVQDAAGSPVVDCFHSQPGQGSKAWRLVHQHRLGWRSPLHRDVSDNPDVEMPTEQAWQVVFLTATTGVSRDALVLLAQLEQAVGSMWFSLTNPSPIG